MNGYRALAFLTVCGLAVCIASPAAQAQYYAGPGYSGYGGPVYSGGYPYVSGAGFGAYGANNSWGIGASGATYYGIGATSNGYSPGGYTGPYYGGAYGYSGYAYQPSYDSSGYAGRVPVYVSPAPVVGTTTTILRGGPTGGVIQYSKDGNGYTYSADSAYSGVIVQSPIVGPSRVNYVDTPKPVVIESRPSGSAVPSTRSPSRIPPVPASAVGDIKLSCPKSAPGNLTCKLNGHPYTIRPGYSQTFANDREWIIEFRRRGDGSEMLSYTLNAGLYVFTSGSNGWDLEEPGATTTQPIELPPAPLPPPPLPAP